jgi:hypothetical protein
LKRSSAIVLIAICYSECLFAQKQNISTPITVSGNLQLTNNGTAPAPIFALGRPAIISSTFIKKGNFYFNPEFYFGLDAKPWIINARIGYNIIDNKKITLGLALNPSFFFLQRIPTLNNNEEYQLQRYLGNELNGEIRVTNNRKIQFNFWHSFRLDKLGVKREEFLNLVYSMENLKLGSSAIFAFRPSAFYLFDSETIEGIFISQTSNFQMTNWKFNFYIQTTIPVKVTPKNSFIWNFGVNVPF